MICYRQTNVVKNKENKYFKHKKLISATVCLQSNEPVMSRLVLFTKVIECKIMATVVEGLKKLAENG